MNPHVTFPRYPIDNFNPLDFYDKNLPLIQNFKDISNILEKTLNKIEHIIIPVNIKGNENAIH